MNDHAKDLAFPQPIAIGPMGNAEFPGQYGPMGGMTIREHAAIQIAAGLAAHYGPITEPGWLAIQSRAAVAAADALIEELAK